MGSGWLQVARGGYSPDDSYCRLGPVTYRIRVFMFKHVDW